MSSAAAGAAVSPSFITFLTANIAAVTLSSFAGSTQASGSPADTCAQCAEARPDCCADRKLGGVRLDSLFRESSVVRGNIVEINFNTNPIARISQMRRIKGVITQTYDFWDGLGEPTIYFE